MVSTSTFTLYLEAIGEDGTLYLRCLELTNFRNFQKETFTFQQAGALVLGDNGQGKSNLLEAIHFLAIAKSVRATTESEVVCNGADAFTLRGEVSRGSHHVVLSISYSLSRGKHIHLNGELLSRSSDLLGTFNSVIFSPEDVDLALRFPAGRRRMLDIVLSQSGSSYVFDLQSYRKALAQRNRLLKFLRHDRHATIDELGPWEAELSKLCARIVQQRLRLTASLRPDFTKFYKELSHHSEDVSISYDVAAADVTEDTASEDVYLEALARKRPDELRVGYTLVGPHRDNLSICINGLDIQATASQGQLKTILLAWKLAEGCFLQRSTGQQPVLLLDDAFSELDRRRSDALSQLMEHFGQIFLTSAVESEISSLPKALERIYIREGRRVS